MQGVQAPYSMHLSKHPLYVCAIDVGVDIIIDTLFYIKLNVDVCARQSHFNYSVGFVIAM